MQRIRFVSVLLVLLAMATICIAQSAVQRSVVLELSLPNGSTPQLRVAEGETASVEHEDFGKLGFVPRIQDVGSSVEVKIFDLGQTPHRLLGQVEAGVAGDAVQSETKPPIGVRVVRVVTQ